MFIPPSLVTSEENTTALVSYCFHMPRPFIVVIYILHICNNVCTVGRFTTIASYTTRENPCYNILNGDITKYRIAVEIVFFCSQWHAQTADCSEMSYHKSDNWHFLQTSPHKQVRTVGTFSSFRCSQLKHV